MQKGEDGVLEFIGIKLVKINGSVFLYPRHASIYSLNDMFYCHLGPSVYTRYLVIIVTPKLEKLVLPFRTTLVE